MAAMAITAYSLSELIGKNFSMIMEEGIFPESGEVSARTWGVWKHKSAREIPVYCNYRLVRDLRGNISSVVYVARDISDYKNTEEELIKAWQALKSTQDQLMQNEKMAAIGRLAGCMAHEIRNPLAVISQGLAFLRALGQRGGLNIEEETQRLSRSLGRIEDIINRLLNFSRLPIEVFEPCDIRRIIDDGLSFGADHAKFSGTHIIKEYPGEPVWVAADAVMLTQVFVNLTANSLDAMKKDGCIQVKVYRQEDNCVTEFTDNGRGIALRDLSKVFEPFYTTKRLEKGTGLGLLLVYLIIERHKGQVTVDSKPGQGATFTIKLPMSNVQMAK
jgi:two-component system NtrC family sensor kinase